MRAVVVRHEEKIRYVAVGAVNTLFGYLVFASLYELFGRTVNYLLILVVSYVISISFAYVGHKLLVFRTSAGWVGEYVRFYVVYGLAFLLNMALLWVLVDAGAPVLVAQAGVILPVVAFSYLGNRHFTFARTDADAADLERIERPASVGPRRRDRRETHDDAASAAGGRRRILMLIHRLGVGGVERMLVNIANGLDRDLFETTVLALSQDNPLAALVDPSAAEVIELPRRWRFDLSPADGIARVIADRRVDTILAFGLFESFFVGRAAPRFGEPPPPVIVAVHNTRPVSFRQRAQHRLYARRLSGGERITAVCDAQAEYLSRAYRIPGERLTTIHNGIDVEHFRPCGDHARQAQLRDSLGIPPGAFTLVQVASFNRWKNHESALEALAYTAAQNGHVPTCLIFVGGGPSGRSGELERAASRLGVRDRVVFAGVHDDVRPFYEAADAFTLTSSVEGLPVAAIEAMSMGLPCVLTDVGGARELIRDGIDGYLVPTGDARAIGEGWMRVRENPRVFDAAEMRARAVERFSIESCLAGYTRLLG